LPNANLLSMKDLKPENVPPSWLNPFLRLSERFLDAR